MAYKHALAVKVMEFIVNLAFERAYVFPGDVPEEIVAKEHRQGVVSNAWGALESLEIIELLPMNFTDQAAGIFGGRKKNTNEGAKGRWTGVYRLKNRGAAETWLKRNGVLRPATTEKAEPMDFAFA